MFDITMYSCRPSEILGPSKETLPEISCKHFLERGSDDFITLKLEGNGGAMSVLISYKDLDAFKAAIDKAFAEPEFPLAK